MISDIYIERKSTLWFNYGSYSIIVGYMFVLHHDRLKHAIMLNISCFRTSQLLLGIILDRNIIKYILAKLTYT